MHIGGNPQRHGARNHGLGWHSVRHLVGRRMDQRAFETYMDQLFTELGTGERLILGVSDNVPPDVNLSRLEQIKQWIKAFGPVNPT